MDDKHNKAVIFDLDDTLYPSRDYILSGCKAVANYVSDIFGICVFDNLVHAATPYEHSCLDDKDVLSMIEEALSSRFSVVDSHVLLQLEHVFFSHRPKLSLYDDARMSLAVMRGMGFRLGLVGPGTPSIQRAKVNALGLNHLVDSIIYPDDLLGESRMGDALLMLELDMETPLDKSVFVGTACLTDFRPASAAGMRTVGVSRSGKAKSGAIHTIPALRGLTDVITRSQEPCRDNTIV